MASPQVTSPTERGSLQYFQRARSRWQSSPRKKLSPMPQTELKSPPPPIFGFSGLMPPPSQTKTSDEKTLITKSVAEKHAMALMERKGGPSVAVSETSDKDGNIVQGDAVSTQTAIATRLFQSETTEQESKKVTNYTDNESYRDRLVAFYTEHNPSKLDTVDETLAKFQGKESELFEKLHKKYASGIPPPSGEGPSCFLEFEYGEKKGRVEVTLFADKTPLAAENFRALCTGEKGMGRSSKPLCFRNCTMHRVVENFVIQGGDFTKGDGTGGESIYPPNSEHGDMWGKFKDELFMQHNRKGLLSMANNGANRNGSQFFITLAALANLNEKHVVFGEVTSGMEMVQEISKLATDKKQRPMERVLIRDCGEIRDGQDIRASDTVDESLPSTTPFGFTACKPASFASVANSKESPFSVPSSTKSAGFGSTNASPFSFSASSPKPFKFGGAGATKPFSFAASAATTSQSVPSKGSVVTSPAAKTQVVNDTDDDSSQSSASTTPSEDSSNEEEPSVRHADFSATEFSGQSGTTSGFSFSTDSAEPVKPFSFAAPTLKNQTIDDKADQPKPLPSNVSSTYPSLSSKTALPFNGGLESTSTSAVPVFGASSKLGGSFASAPAAAKSSESSAYPPLSSKAPVPFESEKIDACDLNESSAQTPAPVFGSGGSVPVFGFSSSSGGGFAALASTSPAQTADKGVSSAASPFGAVSKSAVGGSTMVKPLFGNVSSKPTATVDVKQKPCEQSDSSPVPSTSASEEPSTAMAPPPTNSRGKPTYPPLPSKAPAPFRGGKSGMTLVDKDDDLAGSSTETEVSSTSNDVASSTEISEVNSQSSTDAVSPCSRDATVSTIPKDTASVLSQPTVSSFFEDFAHGKPVDAPKVDRTQTKTNFAFGGITAVGQPSVTSKLPTSDNPFKTFSVSKSTTALSSSFSFGNTAAPATSTKDAPSTSSKEHNDNKTPSTSSFGNIAAAPVSDKDRPPVASHASENQKSTFSFAFAQSSGGSNEAPKTPVGSPSRFSGWFAGPKDKKD